MLYKTLTIHQPTSLTGRLHTHWHLNLTMLEAVHYSYVEDKRFYRSVAFIRACKSTEYTSEQRLVLFRTGKLWRTWWLFRNVTYIINKNFNRKFIQAIFVPVVVFYFVPCMLYDLPFHWCYETNSFLDKPRHFLQSELLVLPPHMLLYLSPC